MAKKISGCNSLLKGGRPEGILWRHGYTRKGPDDPPALIGATEYDLQVLYFEDLPLGGEWTTRRRTISQADLTAFTGVAGDFNPLHVDEEHARGTHFGAVLVPAGLIASAAIGLGSMDAPIPATVGMLGMNWKFLKPVKVGDSICGRWRLARVRKVANPAWGVAAWQVAVLNQHEEVVAQGEITRLVARRGVSGEEQARVSGTDVAAADSSQVDAAPRGRGRGRDRQRLPDAAAQTPLETARETIEDEGPAPEPAPADVPSPSRRRRRGRGRSGGGSAATGTSAAAGDAVPPSPPVLEVAQVQPATGGNGNPAGSGRRRRRGRGRGGAGTGSGAGADTGSSEPPPPAAPAAPAASAPPNSAPTGGDGAGGGRFGRVLRRLRGT